MLTIIMRNISLLILLVFLVSNSENLGKRTHNFPKLIEKVAVTPKKDKVWVFILAGQSNMAGRGLVEPQDTVAVKNILTINKEGELIYAKEPLHFYEPRHTGLDCGLTFAKSISKFIPDSITVLLIPTAVGGSNINQWLNNSIHRDVQLYSNFVEKVQLAKKYGVIKGILWHQGESDASGYEGQYKDNLNKLFANFRCEIDNPNLPIVMGYLGAYSQNRQAWEKINKQITEYTKEDPNTAIIPTADLKDRGDKKHFNSEGQRIIGQRMANAYINKFYIQPLNQNLPELSTLTKK